MEKIVIESEKFEKIVDQTVNEISTNEWTHNLENAPWDDPFIIDMIERHAREENIDYHTAVKDYFIALRPIAQKEFDSLRDRVKELIIKKYNVTII